MTAKTTGPKPAALRRKAKPKIPTVTIHMVDTENEEEATRVLTENFPDWGKLSKDERADLVKLTMAYRRRGDPVTVKLIKKPEGGYSIGVAGKNETLTFLKLQQTFSTNGLDPLNARADELLKYLGSVGALNDGKYNAALSFIESMAPKDQAEALLLVQMYITHDAAIRALSAIGNSEWVPHTQMWANLATKLLRVSQGQMETLSRMRRGGEQVVRHIHVDNRGGQAVIAETVQTGGQGNGKVDELPLNQGALSPSLLGAHAPLGVALPIPGHGEREMLPAWGSLDRPAEGQQERMEARTPLGSDEG